MKKIYSKSFESVNASLHRMKVPGGWLVKSFTIEASSFVSSVALIFIPDPNYDWNLEEGV
jgi:hypothetical protein